MSLPQFQKQDILKALDYIDKNGVPSHNESIKYSLISDSGKKYPPKYVIAVARHLRYGTPITTQDFVSVDAVKRLKSLGFSFDSDFELRITAEGVSSSDENFSLDNLSIGDSCVQIDTYFEKANGERITRHRDKGEKKKSNRSLPLLACQLYEKQLSELSDEDKASFPVYRPTNGHLITGIYPSIEEFQKARKTIEYLAYQCKDGQQLVIYSWNVFSTVLFVQECLKRFGEPGDSFVLKYCYKNEQAENDADLSDEQTAPAPTFDEQAKYSKILLQSKNLIFRGAPGTGKSYLAREIATYIVSKGKTIKYDNLSADQKKQIEFVQFHPNYDYTDFVEGLRPKINDDGTMGFELKDGVFKRFVTRARKNLENSKKSDETIKKEVGVQQSISAFFSDVKFGLDKFKTITGNEFTITNVDDDHIYISIPGNATINKLTLNLDEIRKMLMASDHKFNKVKDITSFFGKSFAAQAYSYDFAIYNEIKAKKNTNLKISATSEEEKTYVFIIDEINRGEISKIFGELFFAIDPGYRGKSGEISTQYSNLHSDPDEKFFIPENVYIIGTMNDIDRSVDSFDFAMRRRFRFIELKASDEERIKEILSDLQDKNLIDRAINKMNALNKEISNVDGLNDNYQIGAAYFLKLSSVDNDFSRLWTDYLLPLLQEYVQGMYDENGIIGRFKKAYENHPSDNQGDINESAQNQG
jgi:DNA polymerase III delta prime subunit